MEEVGSVRNGNWTPQTSRRITSRYHQSLNTFAVISLGLYHCFTIVLEFRQYSFYNVHNTLEQSV